MPHARSPSRPLGVTTASMTASPRNDLTGCRWIATTLAVPFIIAMMSSSDFVRYWSPLPNRLRADVPAHRLGGCVDAQSAGVHRGAQMGGQRGVAVVQTPQRVTKARRHRLAQAFTFAVHGAVTTSEPGGA